MRLTSTCLNNDNVYKDISVLYMYHEHPISYNLHLTMLSKHCLSLKKRYRQQTKDAQDHEKKALQESETAKAEKEIAVKQHEEMQQQMAKDMTAMRRELQVSIFRNREFGQCLGMFSLFPLHLFAITQLYYRLAGAL